MLAFAIRASAFASTQECPLICTTRAKPLRSFTVSVYSRCVCAHASVASTPSNTTGRPHACMEFHFIGFLLFQDASRSVQPCAAAGATRPSITPQLVPRTSAAGISPLQSQCADFFHLAEAPSPRCCFHFNNLGLPL